MRFFIIKYISFTFNTLIIYTVHHSTCRLELWSLEAFSSCYPKSIKIVVDKSFTLWNIWFLSKREKYSHWNISFTFNTLIIYTVHHSTCKLELWSLEAFSSCYPKSNKIVVDKSFTLWNIWFLSKREKYSHWKIS